MSRKTLLRTANVLFCQGNKSLYIQKGPSREEEVTLNLRKKNKVSSIDRSWLSPKPTPIGGNANCGGDAIASPQQLYAFCAYRQVQPGLPAQPLLFAFKLSPPFCFIIPLSIYSFLVVFPSCSQACTHMHTPTSTQFPCEVPSPHPHLFSTLLCPYSL